MKLLERLNGDSIGSLLVKASSGSFVVKILGAGIAFIVQIWVARLLGAENYGIYIYVLAWVSFLALFAKLGMDSSLIRFVSAYNAKHEWSYLNGVIKTSFSYVSWMSLVISIVFSAIIYLSRDKIVDVKQYTFYLAAILLPILAITGLRQASLQGLRKVVRAQFPDSILRPITLGVTLYSFSMVLPEISAQHAMLANLFAASSAFALGSYWLYKAIPYRAKKAVPLYRKSEWIKVSVPMLFVSAFHLVMSQTDIIMVSIIVGDEGAGVYGASARIASLVSFGLIAVNSIVAPLISELYQAGKLKELQRMITLAARGIFIFTVIVSVVLFVFGEWLLSLFGNEFIDGYTPLAILLLGQAVNALAGSVGFLMTMTGHQKESAKIIGACAFINVLLNLLFIPVYGIVGAAMATAISMSVWNIFMFIFVQKRLGINSTILARL